MINYGMPDKLIPKMRERLECNKGFWLTVTGNSMNPTFSHLRDKVYISPFSGKAKKGDILLTVVNNNHCLLHRVIKCEDDMIYYKGDAQLYCEGPYSCNDVIGIVTKAERNGKIFSVNSLFRFVSFVGRNKQRVKRNIINMSHKAKKK